MNKKFYTISIYTFLLFVCLCNVSLLKGQTENKEIPVAEDVEDELLDLELPPLQVLLDSAVALAPERRYALLIAEEERVKFKSAKLNLLNMLSLRASYNYGQIGGNYLQESEIYQPILNYSRSNQNYINAGVYLNVSISEILDLRNKKKITKLKIKQQEEDGRRVEQAVRINVINEYRKFQLALATLKAKANKLNANKAQFLLVQKNFEKGVADINSFSNIRTSYADAQVDYEITNNEARTSLLVLEVLTGIKLIN
ncbi:MAG: TolC family protein [Bacteroidales bacterium]|nr:TolC family protein [Bacteroidales bacterium]